MPLDAVLIGEVAFEVNSLPLSLTIILGWPRSATSLSSSRPTRMPDSDVSTTSARYLRVDTIAEARGRPLMIVSDNGTELTSRAILQWQEDNRVEWHYIAPGKPTQNVRSGLEPVAPRCSPSRA